MRKQRLLTEGIGTHRHIERYSDLSFDKIADEIRFLISSFEKRFSRFDPDSLLSSLNQKREILTDDADFFDMLRLWVEAQELSNGAFSLFVGSDLEAIGYGKSAFCAVFDEQSENRLSRDESGKIKLWGTKNIDLWWVGKGYLIGLIEKLLMSYDIEYFHINGGGDILIRQEELSQFWAIILQNPMHADEMIGKAPILKGACCGSGTIYRHREYQGTQHHHLIDPKTQKPVQTCIIWLYVQHEQIVIADMLATTLFVAPIQEIEAIASRFWGEYLLIFDDMSSIRSPGFCFEY